MALREQDVAWEKLEWEVCSGTSSATINGSPLTAAQKNWRLDGVAPTISVPWGPAGTCLHDVSVSVGGHPPGSMTLEEAMRAVSAHVRHMVVTRAELEEVGAIWQARYGAKEAAAALHLLKDQQLRKHKPVLPRHILPPGARWGCVVRDPIEPHQLVLCLK